MTIAWNLLPRRKLSEVLVFDEERRVQPEPTSRANVAAGWATKRRRADDHDRRFRVEKRTDQQIVDLSAVGVSAGQRVSGYDPVFEGGQRMNKSYPREAKATASFSQVRTPFTFRRCFRWLYCLREGRFGTSAYCRSVQDSGRSVEPVGCRDVSPVTI